MVGYIEESTGGNFKPTPEGQHEMICVRVVDIGTQKQEGPDGQKFLRKVCIVWEVQGQRSVIDGQDVPMLHTERYTWSFHEKANLRKALENWRGVPFKQEDFAGPPHGFHVRKLLGVPCYAQVMHMAGKNGKTYANITSIMRYHGKPEAWPKPEGDLIFFDLDAFEQAAFDKLPKRMKAVIAETPEGAELIHRGVMRYVADVASEQGSRDDGNQSRGQSHGGQSGSYGAGGRPGGGRNDMDDEIPFAAEWRA